MSKNKNFILGRPNQPPTRAAVHTHTESHSLSVTVSGPLPAPEVIQGYETVLPGAADRIIKMAESEQAHHHKMEEKNEKRRFTASIIGQTFGFVLGMTGIIGGVVLLVNDKSVTGFSVFITSLATLVGAFVYQRRKAKNATKPTPPKS